MLINQSLEVAAQKSIEGKMFKDVDGKHVPYATTDEILNPESAYYIPATRRHIGQEFKVSNGDESDVDTWHFVGGIDDTDLVQKLYGTTGDFATNTYVNNADSALQTAINTLQTALQQNIDDEATARTSADLTKADLVGGKVPSAQLPSYVDDILEYATQADLPNPGETGKIYLITTGIDANKQFRWTGSVYVEVGKKADIALLSTVNDFATFADEQSSIIVKDQARGGVFIKYTGANPVDNGLIFQDANSNKWQRQTQDARINVAWFGVLGDGTDESTRIQTMINALSGVVHLLWNNATYRFYGAKVSSTVTNLTMEFNKTTWCYPLRNAGTTPTEWYRFFDGVGQQNYQLSLNDVPKVLLKGTLVLDGERRLGNSFNSLNSTGGVYNGEGLAPIIVANASNLAISQLVPFTKTAIITPDTTLTSDGCTINTTKTSFNHQFDVSFTNRPGYIYYLKYTVTWVTGTTWELWDTAGTVGNARSGSASYSIPIPSATTYGVHTYKLYSKDTTNITISNLRVEEIYLNHQDTYFKTQGDFKVTDHGFSALGINTDASPSYNLVDINDWTWFKTIFGGMRIMGSLNKVRLNNMYIFDPSALSFEEPIFNGNTARGISVTPFDFTNPVTWAQDVHFNNIRMKYSGGYILPYAAKRLLCENMVYDGWGKYVGGDGVERLLGQNTSSTYDIKSAVGGPALKIDPTYWTEDFKFTFRNITFKDTSTYAPSGYWFFNLWFQSGVKNIQVENCKLDSLVKPSGTGDFDPTSQSWSYDPYFTNCEFTETSRLLPTGYYHACKWTRKAIMKTSLVDIPNAVYSDTVEAMTLSSGVFSNCEFTARNINTQIIGAITIFKDCDFYSTSMPLTASQDGVSHLDFARVFNIKFIRCKRVIISLPAQPVTRNKGNCIVSLDNCEIVLGGYTGTIADLTNVSSDIRQIFDCATYIWNTLKIYDKAGNLLHDLQGSQWITEPTSVSDYGVEGTYYETPTKRYDYKSGGGKITAQITGQVDKVTVGNGSIAGTGTGYTTATVSFSGAGGTGTGATGTLNIWMGVIFGITVTNPGSGYVYPITVTITGDGTGATATATMKNASVTGYIINNGGSYVSAPTLSIYDAGGANLAKATCSLTNGAISTVTPVSTAATFATPPTVYITGGVQWTIVNKSNRLSASAALDFGSIAAAASQDLTIALAGAALGDTINIGLPATAPIGLVFNAFVSAADTVTIRATNITAAAIDAPSDTFKVAIMK